MLNYKIFLQIVHYFLQFLGSNAVKIIIPDKNHIFEKSTQQLTNDAKKQRRTQKSSR